MMIPLVYAQEHTNDNTWNLTVFLNGVYVSFGTGTITVSLQGPYNYKDSVSVSNSQNPQAYFNNIGSSDIPVGIQYKVCVSTLTLGLFPSCQMFSHNVNNDESFLVDPFQMIDNRHPYYIWLHCKHVSYII